MRRSLIVGQRQDGPRRSPRWRESEGHAIHAVIDAAENAGGRALTRGAAARAPTSPSSSPGPTPWWPTSSGSSRPASPPSPARPAGRPSSPRITALVERAGRRPAPRRQLLARRAPLPPRRAATWRAASPGSPGSTPLYWRSTTRPSSTRRRAPRASSRRRLRRGGSGAGRFRSPRSGPAPRRAPTRVTYDGPYETVTLATWPGAARASPPARSPRPSGCPGDAGSSPSRTCSSETSR